MCPTSLGSAQPGRASERGAALIFALLGLCTLTVLGLGLTGLGMMATRMTSNERDTQQALALADAGLAHARKLITFNDWDWANLTPFLTGGDGIACTGDELSQVPVPPAGMVPIPAGFPTLFIRSAAAGGEPIGTGTYRVYVCDDHDTDGINPTTGVLDDDPDWDNNRRILVRSVGTTPNGATATVEHVYQPASVPALLVNGNLKVRGDVDVEGTNGVIHSNGTTQIVGNSACAEQYFSATQQITGGIPEGGAGCNETGEIRPGSAPVTIRNIDASNYRLLAEYWLDIRVTVVGPNSTVSGVVRRNPSYPAAAANDAAMVVCPTVFPDVRCPAVPAGWTFNRNGYEWRSNGNVHTTVYYATTHVSLGGNLRSDLAINTAGTTVPTGTVTATGPVTPGMTVLAQGSILLGGGATVLGKLNVPGTGQMALISNQDLNLNGTSGGGGAVWSGLLYARHQMEVSGGPQIFGQVVALNAADINFPVGSPDNQVNPSNPVRLTNDGFMEITGTPNIVYNGNGMMGTLPRAWRECRADPANVNPFFADDACGPLYGGT
jgi:hypothetical protein